MLESAGGLWRHPSSERFDGEKPPSGVSTPRWIQAPSRQPPPIRINGDFAEVGKPPIHYLYRSLPEQDLVAYYRAADVMLVTPLRDGMNLVAKEYVATRYDNTGVLILSEFAGAAEQLTQALLVNPYDLDGLAATMEEAISIAPDEANRRMKALRRSVSSHDVFWWAERCLSALGI